MEQMFNLTRFSKLFIKHTAENLKSYLMSLLVLVGILLTGGSFMVYISERPFSISLQMTMFSSTLLLAGTIFTSTVFTNMGDKSKAMSSLTLPASHFEKYLVAWIYSLILFTVIFIAVFYPIMMFLMSLKTYPGFKSELFSLIDEEQVFTLFCLFTVLHSISFFGAILFKDMHFIKTAFAFFIAIAIIIVVNELMLQLMLGIDFYLPIPFGSLTLKPAGANIPRDNIFIAGQLDSSFFYFRYYALSLIFWLAAYYRLKEKQV